MGAGLGVGFEGVRFRDEGVATLATRMVSRASWSCRRGVLEVVGGAAVLR
jgi:hypothetical protein